MKKRLCLLALLLMGTIPNLCLAWDGETTGKISVIAVTAAGNLPFRVFLEQNPPLCGNGMAEGYVDDADPNYKVYVAALMMAKAMGSTVTLYATVGGWNRCKIGYVVVQ